MTRLPCAHETSEAAGAHSATPSVLRLAEQDCEAVLAKDPDNIKALLRRASARCASGIIC